MHLKILQKCDVAKYDGLTEQWRERGTSFETCLASVSVPLRGTKKVRVGQANRYQSKLAEKENFTRASAWHRWEDLTREGYKGACSEHSNLSPAMIPSALRLC